MAETATHSIEELTSVLFNEQVMVVKSIMATTDGMTLRQVETILGGTHDALSALSMLQHIGAVSMTYQDSKQPYAYGKGTAIHVFSLNKEVLIGYAEQLKKEVAFYQRMLTL